MVFKVLCKQSQQCIDLVQAVLTKINTFDSSLAAQNFLAQLPAQISSPVILSYVNAHAFNLMRRNHEFKWHLLSADLLLRDGLGIAIMMRLNGVNPGVNMNGTDLNPRILDTFRGKKIALCGTSHERLLAAKTQLVKRGHVIVLLQNGYEAESVYLAAIAATKPDVIMLGMGMPKQERVAAYLKQHLHYPCLIVNGGAAIDYISGQVSRAPKWMRTLRCEWFYRMLVEPKRLWKRYILGNPIFLWHILCARFANKTIRNL